MPSTLRGSSKKFHRSGVFLELRIHLVNDTVTILLGAWMSRGFSLRPGFAVGQVLAVTREQYVVTVEEEGAEHAAQLLPLLRCPTFAHLLEPAWQWSSLLASWSPSMSSSPFNWLLPIKCHHISWTSGFGTLNIVVS